MPKVVNVEYKPPGAVADDFFYCNEFVSGIRGPIGSGKSTACAFRIWRHLAEATPGKDGIRRARWAIIRNTYPELKTTTIKTWHQWFPPEVGKWQSEGPPTHFIKFPGFEMEIMFLALDRPEDVRKLLSLELTGAWINEAREVPKAILDGLTGRVGRFPSAAMGQSGWCGVIMDTNPPDSDHWWYKIAEEGTPDEFKFFSQPSGRSDAAENLANLPPRYYERAMQGKDSEWIKVYVDGDYGFVQDGKPVWPEFKDGIHVVDVQPDPKLALTLGIDFGLTPACAFLQQSVMGGWRVIDELATYDMGAVRFADVLGQKLRGEYKDFQLGGVWGDPAGDQRAQTDETTPFSILRAANIPARPAPSNDFVQRREAVAVALSRLIDGTPGLVVSPRCRTIRKGMAGGYRYRRVQVSGHERYHDQPEKNSFSHPCEALQYAMLGAGEGRRLLTRADTWRMPVAVEGMNYLSEGDW